LKQRVQTSEEKQIIVTQDHIAAYCCFHPYCQDLLRGHSSSTALSAMVNGAGLHLLQDLRSITGNTGGEVFGGGATRSFRVYIINPIPTLPYFSMERTYAEFQTVASSGRVL
jgi:hypothetical protein